MGNECLDNEVVDDEGFGNEIMRNDRMYWVGRRLTSSLFKAWHSVETPYEGIEHIPDKGPVLLLPKHRLKRDIPLIGDVLASAGRADCNFFMKDTLKFRGLLKNVGGVPIYSQSKLAVEHRRDGLLDSEKERLNGHISDYLGLVYGLGEVVVAFPEGTRKKAKMGRLKNQVLELNYKMMDDDNKLGLTVIPVGIEKYGNGFRGRAKVRIGEPLEWEEDFKSFERTVRNRIMDLSGISS